MAPKTPSPPLETGAHPDGQPSKSQSPLWRTLLIYGGLALVFYFGHVEVQSYLGRQALDEVPFEKYPLDVALNKARAENKQVLLDVSAIWCPSCRKLDKQVLAQPAVAEAIQANYVFSRVEYESDEGEAVMKKYHVSGFPTLLILDSQGNKLQKLPLTFNPETFIALIRKAQL